MKKLLYRCVEPMVTLPKMPPLWEGQHGLSAVKPGLPTLSDRGTRFLGAGLTMAVTAGLFACGGYLLDGALGTLPLFVVVGALLGFGGGFIRLLSMVAPELLPWSRKKSSSTSSDANSDEPD